MDDNNFRVIVELLKGHEQRTNLLDVEVRNEHGANALLTATAEGLRKDSEKYGRFLYEGKESVTALLTLLMDDMESRRKKEAALWSALVVFGLGLIGTAVKVFLLSGKHGP